jgi:hypothetical protein
MTIGKDLIRNELHRQSLSRWAWRKRKLRRLMKSICFWRK